MARRLKLLCQMTTAAVAAIAASQVRAGETGPTSRATLAISLSIAPRVDVQGLTQADLREDQSRALCVSASTPTRGYGVSLLTSSVTAGSASEETAGRTIAIDWASASGESQVRRIVAGSPVMGFVAGAGHCTGQSAPNASMIVSTLPAAAASGAESDTVATLLIVPE